MLIYIYKRGGFTVIGLLICVIIIAALFYLVFAVHHQHRLTKYILKPGTMSLIIILAIYGSGLNTTFSKWIVIGLLFSVGGDIFLMLTDKWFVHGLISFFMAHIFYIIGLYGALEFSWSHALVSGIILLVIAVIFFSYLVPAVNEEGGMGLTVAVALYIIMISIMVWFAIITGNKLLILAALLFYISDAVLAIDKFRCRFKIAEYTIMTTYFSAQLLFALSMMPILT